MKIRVRPPVTRDPPVVWWSNSPVGRMWHAGAFILRRGRPFYAYAVGRTKAVALSVWRKRYG